MFKKPQTSLKSLTTNRILTILGIVCLFAMLGCEQASTSVDPVPTVTAMPTATPTQRPTATIAPTATPAPTATAVPTATPTQRPTATIAPTATPAPTATAVPTATPTQRPTATIAPAATPAPTATAVPTATPVPTATITPTATPVPTATITPTATPVPTATLAPIASRSNPIPIGKALTLEGQWKLWVENVNLNGKDVVLSENYFNDPPKSNHNFALIRIGAEYLGESEGTFGVDVSDNVIGNQNRFYNEGCGVIPNPMFDQPTVLKGGQISGNICIEYPAAEADSLLLTLRIGFSRERYYFALR